MALVGRLGTFAAYERVARHQAYASLEVWEGDSYLLASEYYVWGDVIRKPFLETLDLQQVRIYTLYWHICTSKSLFIASSPSEAGYQNHLHGHGPWRYLEVRISAINYHKLKLFFSTHRSGV